MKIPLATLIAIVFCILACQSKSQEGNLQEQEEPTLEEMIGQMLMVGFRGMNLEEVSPAIQDDLRNGRIGNVILFDYDVVNKAPVRNIESPQQVSSLITDLQQIAKSTLFVAVDQEGGRVNRLKTRYGFPKSVSNQYLGDLDNIDSTRFYATRNAKTLQKLGFNVNFSPDVDLNINPENPVIGNIGRSYGASVEKVIRHASVWIQEHQSRGILSTLKHYPGHGSSKSDSHYGFTDITDHWTREELLPFEKLSDLQGVAIMTAHVVNMKLDTFPATLSAKVIKDIVRDKWHFDGLLFSDDLHMGAVNDLYGFETIIKRSIDAGVDIMVFGNNLKYEEDIPSRVITTVMNLVESGQISKTRIKASYDRIQGAKSQVQ